MKHLLIWLLRILLCAAVLVGCYQLTLYLSGQFDPPAMVGHLDASDGADWVDEQALGSAVCGQELLFEVRDVAPADLPEAARGLCEAGARALTISLSAPLPQKTADALLALAQEHGVSLIFVGEYPGDAVLGGPDLAPDLAWYLGSDPALAGEMLGQQAAVLFREGDAPDWNEDHLLQYLWLADEQDAHRTTLRRYLLEACEHYGVYSVELSSLQGAADELQTEAQATWGELAGRPEILLCSGPEAARAARQSAEALGWRGAGQPLPILCAAPDEETARALIEDGTAAGCCYYDRDGVTAALAKLAVNAAHREYVAQDTDLTPDGHAFLLPYRDVQAAG